MGNQADRQAGVKLILIKHGHPVIDPTGPRSEWALSAEGRAAASRLAHKLLPLAPERLFCSPEPKAFNTAQVMGEVLGLTPEPDAGLGEQRADRNAFGTPAAFEASVAQMFAEPDRLVLGEETGRAAADRIEAAMARITEGQQGARAVVAHGRILTLWLMRRFGVEPMPFWRRLGLASAAVVATDGISFVDP